MIFLLLIVHPISYLLFRYFNKGKAIILSTQPISITILLTIVTYLIASYLFEISLAGTYTDFIVGIIAFSLLDFWLVGRKPIGFSSFCHVYNFIRKVYVIYNTARVGFFWCFLVFHWGLPITYPVQNMNRAPDVLVFNKFYINSVRSNFPPYLELDHCTFSISKRRLGIFKQIIFKSNECPTVDITSGSIQNKGTDSAGIWGYDAYIYRKNKNWYFSDDGQTIELN